MTNKDNTIHIIEIQIKKLVESIRPPVELRDELDIGYDFQQNTLELFEIRPKWDNKDEIIHSPIAKSRFIKVHGIWKVYWMRANGRWESYQPHPEVKSIDGFFALIQEDKYGCFFG